MDRRKNKGTIRKQKAHKQEETKVRISKECLLLRQAEKKNKTFCSCCSWNPSEAHRGRNDKLGTINATEQTKQRERHEHGIQLHGVTSDPDKHSSGGQHGGRRWLEWSYTETGEKTDNEYK